MEKEALRFEEAMSQLEEIVKKLEAGDVPLEEAITLYKKGMELSSVCHGKLQHAEKQLMTIIDEEGQEKSMNMEKGAEKNG